MKNKIMWIDVFHSTMFDCSIISIKRNFDTRAYFLHDEVSRLRVERILNNYPHVVEVNNTKLILHIDFTSES